MSEEALELWKTALRFTATLTPELASLLPTLIRLLHDNSDILPIVLKLTESYALLDCEALLQNYGSDLFAAFDNLLAGDMKFEAVKTVLHAFNTLIQSSTSWPTYLQSSNCFVKLIMPLEKANVSAAIFSFCSAH